jgi:hypothetical protein
VQIAVDHAERPAHPVLLAHRALCLADAQASPVDQGVSEHTCAAALGLRRRHPGRIQLPVPAALADAMTMPSWIA